MEALVLTRLINQIPSREVVDADLSLLHGRPLADPELFQPAQVDMILGADVYACILRDGVQHISPGHLVAQNTAFDWVLYGAVVSNRRLQGSNHPLQALHCETDIDLLSSLQRFWETEEVARTPRPQTPQDEWCEKHFLETHNRNAAGRYMVRLPLQQTLTPDQG